MQPNRQATKAEEVVVTKDKHVEASIYLSMQAAALMGVHERTVSWMIKRGKLVARHARNKRVQILRQDVERQGLQWHPQSDRLEQLTQDVQALEAQLHTLQGRSSAGAPRRSEWRRSNGC
jgi:polyhydroxyalkanoate synthesis regulator phasin